MIFFDLAAPAEASTEKSTLAQASRGRETGIHPRIKSKGLLFGIML
jgi:hypothetical protein